MKKSIQLITLVIALVFFGNKTVFAQCAAAFSFSPNCPTYNFNDLSTSLSGNIVGWSWDFDDGNFSNIPSPSHTYTVNATYNVCLTITTETGCANTSCQMIPVGCIQPPCTFSITCPTNTDLGTFSCTQIGSIPARPTTQAQASAPPYNMTIGPSPCGVIVVLASDDITTYNFCNIGGQTVTRTVTVFDDLNGNGVLDPGEVSQVCSYIFDVLEDTSPPVVVCPPDQDIEWVVGFDASNPSNTGGFALASDNCDPNPTISWTDNLIPGTCAGNFTILRTWTATDDCGQSSQCVQTIVVHDLTNPTVVCPPDQDIEWVVGFDASNPTITGGFATATDDCDPNPTITWTDNLIPGACAGNFTIERTWTATDECNNAGDCVQTIVVHDLTPPMITCPGDITIECGELADPSTTGIATASDTGDPNPAITWNDVKSPLPIGYLMTRTWTATDECGNPGSCDQMIMVMACELEITDPCECIDNSSVIDEDLGMGGDDGQFAELISITGPNGGPIANPNLTFVVIATTGGVDAFAAPPIPPAQTPGVPVPIGTQLLYNVVTMHYELPFYHYDAIGYTMTIQQIVAGAPGQIFEPIGNKCAYPNPAFDPSVPDDICPTSPVFIFGAIDLDGQSADMVTYTVNGAPATDFDPLANPPGLYTVVMTYDGAADGNGGVSPDNGITPVYPGCIQTVQKVMELREPVDFMSCNDELNISLGTECSVLLISEMFFEDELFRCYDDYILTVNGIEDPVITALGSYSIGVYDPVTGNNCWSIVNVEDKLGPVIEAPDLMVDCGTDVTAVEGVNYYIDDCTYYTHHINDVAFGDLCSGDSRIERTITATDKFGNTTVHVQTITFEPLDIGLIVGPNPIVTTTCGVVSMPAIYDYTGDIMDAYPTLDGKPLVPGEYCNFLVAKKDEIVEACDLSCSNSVKVIRRWSIYDWCNIDGEPRQFEQLISAKDLEAPVIAPFTEIDTFSVDPWMCVIENLPLPAATYTELCTPDHVTIEIHSLTGIEVINGVAKDVPVGTHEFAYYAIDCCGNRSLSEIATVEVIDEVIPVAIAKQEIVLSLTYGPAEEEGVAKLYAESVDNGSYDDCSAVTLRVKREKDVCRADSDEYGPFVKFCCRDLGDTIQVWLEVRDTSGNYNETWANVLIEEKFAVIECTDVYIECYDDIDKTISDNRPDAYGTCRSKRVEELSRDESNYDEVCNSGVIYVTWGVRDLNHIRCVQAIYVNYETSIVCHDINWPASFQEVNCVDDLPAPELTWDADPCDLIGWTVRSDTFIFGPDADACRKIVNEYTVIDWCAFDAWHSEHNGGYGYGSNYDGYFEFEGGNDFFDGRLCADPNIPNNGDWDGSDNGVFKYVEVIKVVDDLAPSIEETDVRMYEVDGECQTTIQLVNSAFDAGCQSSLTWEVSIDFDRDGIYEITYTEDRFGDVLKGEALDFTPYYYDSKNGNPPIWFYGPMSSHNVLYKVTDGCGNIDKEEVTIMIVDKKDPTPYCIHLSSAVMESGSVELWARDFDRGSFDNCDAYYLRFTFNEEHPVIDSKTGNFLAKKHYFKGAGEEATAAEYNAGDAQQWDPDQNSSARVFDCDDLGVTDVRMTVWDNKLNSDWCSVELTLIDNQGTCGAGQARASVEGKIATEENKNVSEVEVTIEDVTNGEYELNMMTRNDGDFAFANNPMYTGYDITAFKDGGDMEGVSTLDLVLIQRHILGIEEFDSPYKVIAGDINSDKKVTGTDLVVLRKTILGIYKEFPTNNSWRFYDRSQGLTVEDALQNCREVIKISDLDKNMYGQNFMAVKVGDVNATAKTNARDLGTQTRSGGTVSLELNEQNVRKGDLVDLTFSSKDFDEVYGYQFTLELDGIILESVKAGSASMTDANIGLLDNNALTVSYSDINGLTPSNNMFTITVKAAKDGVISNMIALTSTALNSEAYVGRGLDINRVELTVNGSEANSFRLDQNIPNPFDEATVVGFVLPQAGNASLTVYNVAGKVITTVNSEFARGYNEYKFAKRELNTTGVLYYTLRSGEFTATKKMIILE